MEKNTATNNTAPLFQLTQIDEDIIEGSPSFVEISELFQNARSIDDIINGWMNRDKGRDLIAYNGPSEDACSEGKPAIIFILQEYDKDVAQGQSMISCFTGIIPDWMVITPENKDDETLNEKREEELEIIYNDIYSETQIPRDNVQKFVLCYLLSSLSAEVDFFFASEESLDEVESTLQLEDENAKVDRNYVCMNMLVSNNTESSPHMDGMAGSFVSFFL